MKNRELIITAVLLTVLLIMGCGHDGMTKKELRAVKEVIPNIDEKDIEKIKLSDDINTKFPAIKKAFKVKNGGYYDYAFIAAPVGYRGPINIVAVIDGEQNKVTNVSIVEHDETLIYAESLTEDWFLNRFKGKGVKQYLERVILEATKPHEIVQITAATISTQAVINGVNSAIGAYREMVLKESSQPIPLKVEELVTGVE
ncbi:MAG TPA: FMN-binding protein [Thermoanaerobacterales bacterium]|nr:FMN-binding protein [Thermoanaerobacterales bacterium]